MAKRTLLALAFIITMVAMPFVGRAWATHYFGHNLRYGATGTEVSFLQEYLTEQGYFHYPSTTEYFGPVTFSAVKAWQAANEIPNTGFFGPISRAFVNATSTTNTTLATTTSATTTIITTTTTNPPDPTFFTQFPPTNIAFEGAPAPAQVSVSVISTVANIASDATTTFTATVSNTSNSAVTWSALYGTVNASGIYTAPSIVGTSTIIDTITATSQADTSKSGSVNVTVASDLTGYWPLDEGTGTVALDASGDALNGAWAGTKASASGTYYAPGLVGPYAGSFDGTDNDISMGSSTLFNAQAVTMSAWIYPTADSVQSTVMGKEEQYKLVVKNGQLGILSTCDGLEWNTNQYVSSSVPLNAWTYATFVMNGVSGVDQVYENGTLVASVPNCGKITHFNTNLFEIGGYTGANAAFTGAIDDARFYTRALTASEVQSLYGAVTPPVAISISPTSTTLAAGDTQTFTAAISNATNTAVTWSALYGSVNASGTYTAPSSVVTSTLTDTITATSVASSSHMATATVTVVPAGMAVWLPLDEGTGTIANDISGNGNNGTWSGTMASASGTYYARGIVGNYSGVFSKDGTTKISLISPSALVGNAAKTISLWLSPSELRGTEQDIAEFGDNTTGGQFGLELGNDNHINAHLGATDFESPITAATSTWYFAALTYNGSITSLYVNGTLEATSSATVNTGDANFFIGQHLAYTGLYFAGDVDDVRVYTRALSQSELQEIYHATVPAVSVSITPTSTSLLADATTSFVATVSNASNTAVTWSAVYGSINSSGVYTAPSSTVSSTITDMITATSVADNTKTATATVTVTPGLLGWWPTREGSGSIAYDVSGQGNNGIWYGTPEGNSGYYQSYTSTYAGTFDGSDNYVSTGVLWPSSGSLMLWAGPENLNSWASPAGWKYAPSSGGYILIDEGGSGNWRAVFNSSALGEADVQSTSSISTDAWYQLTMTWNKVGATTTVALYVNGSLQGSTTTAQTATSSIGSFYYGTGGQSANNDFSGFIDDVHVYNRALTSSEIQSIYSAEESANSTWPGVFTNPAA